MRSRRGTKFQAALRTIRMWWLLVAFLSGFAFAMWAEDMALSWRENRLQFSAPRIHFLTGKPLDRLKNASAVPFDFQITLFTGSKTHEAQKIGGRFVVSYDLWEERFSVSKLAAPRRTVSHLTAQAAEAWCLQQLPMDVGNLSASEPLWVRMEIRAETNRNTGPLFGRDSISESGISLNGIVEIFSRPAQADQPHWTVETGPITLNEVRRGRGA